MIPPNKGKLPRLGRHHYQGHAVVFWTNTLEERARGWLTPAFQATFRELMLHAAVREQLCCPAYCLMPDHLHFIWMGLRRESDQLNAMKFLRTQLEPTLGGGREWQHQPHDHVLREEERRRNAFASFCFYTLANPVRAELVKKETNGLTWELWCRVIQPSTLLTTGIGSYSGSCITKGETQNRLRRACR